MIKETLTGAFDQLSTDLAAGKSESLTAYLKAMATFHSYSFNNIMLILVQNPDATRVAGFRAWQKLNRAVKLGESGIVVMAPVMKTVGYRDEIKDDGTKKEVPVRRLVNTKPVYVFDISQTEGEPLPEYEMTTREGDPGQNMGRLEKLYQKHDIELEFVESIPGGAMGVSMKGKVAIVKSLPPAERFLVMVHELLHRDAESRRKGNKTTRETEAEAVAFVVGHALNLKQGNASSDYIQSYGGNAAVLAESMDAVRTASAVILEALLPA